MTAATEPAAASAAPEIIAYHWVITLQGYANGGIASTTTEGSANLPAGYRRSEAYQGITREAQRIIRERPDNAFSGDPTCVLYFSLERDEL